MASWMIHLRIADKLLDRIDGLSGTEFIVGNIAPDSGVPNEDWSVFTPSTTVSHFKDENRNVDIARFTSQHFTPELQKQYSTQQYSFFLGYLTHLLTDIQWAENIYAPTRIRFREEYITYRENFIWKVKEDWYDLDYLYLREHPDFRAFHIYDSAVGFENTYMDIFSPDAFDNRRKYITGFYREPNDHLDREYRYLTVQEAENFVCRAADEILRLVNTEYCV